MSFRLMGTVISIAIGAIITAIALVPEYFISWTFKLVLFGVIIECIVLFGVGYSIFKGISEKGAVLKKIEEDNLWEHILKKIRFISFKRTSRLDSDGGATTVWDLLIKNISKETIYDINLPERRYDIYDGNPEEEYESFLDLMVEGEPFHHITLDTIRTHRRVAIGSTTREINSVKRVETVHTIPLAPNGIESGQTKHIVFRLHTKGCYQKMEEQEVAALKVFDLRDNMELEIVAPPDREIELVCTQAHNRGILIRDLSTGLVDPGETAKYAPPQLARGGHRIVWSLKKPKIGYKYEVYFRLKPIL